MAALSRVEVQRGMSNVAVRSSVSYTETSYPVGKSNF
jgi:hypothetical protein